MRRERDMKCPVCDGRMREVEKEGVVIDICPECKGVWLDRGELEKLLSGVREMRPEFDQWYRGNEKNNAGHHDNKYGKSKPYKKKSFFEKFEDIFGD
jgi:Zn-finger nucleic acid-binding protein